MACEQNRQEGIDWNQFLLLSMCLNLFFFFKLALSMNLEKANVTQVPT